MHTRLRFVPKTTGVRLVQSLCARSDRVAAALANAVIAYERGRRPALLGAAVRSPADVLARMHAFKRCWRRSGRPPLYAAKFDIERAFDAVPLQRLIYHELPRVVGAPPAAGRYVLVRYAFRQRGSGQRGRRWLVCAPDEVASFARLARERVAAQHRDCVLADDVSTTTLRGAELVALLQRQLDRCVAHTVAAGGTQRGPLLQRRGVAQGSPVSSALCDLLLAGFERRALGDVLDAQRRGVCLFMRYVDDVLLLTADRALFRSVRARMRCGSRRFGVRVNPAKSRCASGAGRIPWCGWRVDLAACEVLADAPHTRGGSRGRAGGAAGAAPVPRCRAARLAAHSAQPPAPRTLAREALMHFASRLHPLLLDGRLNRRRTALRNAERVFALSLGRIRALLDASARWHRIDARAAARVVGELAHACARRLLTVSPALSAPRAAGLAARRARAHASLRRVAARVLDGASAGAPAAAATATRPRSTR